MTYAYIEKRTKAIEALDKIYESPQIRAIGRLMLTNYDYLSPRAQQIGGMVLKSLIDVGVDLSWVSGEVKDEIQKG